jgi:hypothetical protein
MAELVPIPQRVNAARLGADIRTCTRIRRIDDARLATPEAASTPFRTPTRARAIAERACT